MIRRREYTPEERKKANIAMRKLRMQDDEEYIMRKEKKARKAQEEQNSLQISNPNDAEEKEADMVAKNVVNGSGANVSSGTGGSVGSKTGTVHPKMESDTSPMADANFEQQLDSSKGSGQSLDDATKREMETKMGADFSGVKIHTDSAANAMAEQINAKAFTYGQDIYFKSLKYDPYSKEGKELLAHELWHVVQNKGGGVKRKIQKKDDPKSLHSIRGVFDSPMTEGIADSYKLISSTEAGKIYIANNILKKVEGSIATEKPKENPFDEGQKINLTPGYYIRYSRQIKIEPAAGGEIYIVIEGATTPDMLIGADPDKMTSEQLLTLHGKSQLSYSIKGINSSKKWFISGGKKTSTSSSLYLLINQNPPEIKKLLDYVGLDNKYMANAIGLANTNPGFEPIIKTDEDVEFLLGHRGNEMYKVGIIAQDEFKVKFTPVPRQKDIDFLGYNFIMPINARVIVLREYNGWFFIRSFDGKSGWVEAQGLAFDPPEATAILYEVKSKDNLFNIVKLYYGLDDKEDKRLYVNAVVYANRASGRKKQFKDTASPGFFEVDDQYHHNPQLVKGTTLWLPSQQFIDALKASGKISSGSFTEQVWNTAKKVIDVVAYIVQFIIAFIGGLVAGFVMSIVDTIVSIVELIAGIVKMIIGIFTGETISQAKELYEAFKNLTWADFKLILAELGQTISSEVEAYWKKMTSENPWEAGYAWGYIVGYIIGLIVITYFTAGGGLAARIVATLAKILGKAWIIIMRILAKMSKLVKKIPVKKLRKLVKKSKTVVAKVVKIAKEITPKTIKHIFEGEINKIGKATGVHHIDAIINGNARISKITKPMNSSGVFEGTVEVFDSVTKKWIAKKFPSTFFPTKWSKTKTLEEISSAFNNPSRIISGNSFEGISNSGIKIKGYLNAAGEIDTAFPIY
jgi:Domain of unknown function (DUF4157)/Bacterial EndoU nuclease